MGLRQFGPAWGALLSAGRHCEDVEARLVPPTGVEPAHMASEANALSAELRGQCFANIGSWCPVLPGRSRLAQEECRIIWKRPQFAQQPLFLSVGECAAIVYTDVEVGVDLPPKTCCSGSRSVLLWTSTIRTTGPLVAGGPLATNTALVSTSWNDLTSVALA
jgi:hypothetical protein